MTVGGLGGVHGAQGSADEVAAGKDADGGATCGVGGDVGHHGVGVVAFAGAVRRWGAGSTGGGGGGEGTGALRGWVGGLFAWEEGAEKLVVGGEIEYGFPVKRPRNSILQLTVLRPQPSYPQPCQTSTHQWIHAMSYGPIQLGFYGPTKTPTYGPTKYKHNGCTNINTRHHP